MYRVAGGAASTYVEAVIDGPNRVAWLAIQARSFRVVEHGGSDFRRHITTVEGWYVQRFSHAGASATYQCERDRSAENSAVVGRSDMAHRADRGALPWRLHDLRSFLEHDLRV